MFPTHQNPASLELAWGLSHTNKAAKFRGASAPGLSALALALISAAACAQGPGAGAAGAASAPAAQAPGAAQSPGTQSAAQQYAAGVSPAVDPRKPAPSAPGALTLKQVLDVASSKNPTLLAARRNLDAVRAQEMQAAVRQNPNIGIVSAEIPEDEHKNNPYSISFQASRLFERGDKRHWRIETAQANSVQTEAQLRDTTRTTLFNVKQAFFQMLIAKQALELDSANLKDFRHEVEIANDRFQAGDLAKLDFERLDLQLGNFEASESQDMVTLRQSSIQLQSLMGTDTPSATFDITNEIVPPALAQSEDQLVALALAGRPDYAAARAGVLAADANYRLSVANGTADPTLEVEYDRTGTENSGGASIQIPLRIFDKNQGNKATAHFQADASRFSETAARNLVVSDVAVAFIGYTQAKRVADRFTQHYLDESRDVLSIAQYAFEHGGIALIDYLDALRDARSSTSDALTAYLNTWLAIQQLSSSAATELVP